MSNHFHHILKQWLPIKDDYQWVLATIIETKGSAYRKAGAHMLINDYGKHLGLLSGGCLEADLMQQALKCWQTGHSYIVTYDMTDDNDIAWQLGIGCGGKVIVLLQPILKANDYLALPCLIKQLSLGQGVFYQQSLTLSEPSNKLIAQCDLSGNHYQTTSTTDDEASFISEIMPIKQMVVFGGGIDTHPVIAMIKSLGWGCTLIDCRTNYARKAYFKGADIILHQAYDTLADNPLIKAADGIIIMHHHLALDAKALELSQYSNSSYIGLLGPKHRAERVFELTNITDVTLSGRLHSPIGLDLGGELPESIALAMVAQIHNHLEKGTGQSIMEKLSDTT